MAQKSISNESKAQASQKLSALYKILDKSVHKGIIKKIRQQGKNLNILIKYIL